MRCSFACVCIMCGDTEEKKRKMDVWRFNLGIRI